MLEGTGSSYFFVSLAVIALLAALGVAYWWLARRRQGAGAAAAGGALGGKRPPWGGLHRLNPLSRVQAAPQPPPGRAPKFARLSFKEWARQQQQRGGKRPV